MKFPFIGNDRKIIIMNERMFTSYSIQYIDQLIHAMINDGIYFLFRVMKTICILSSTFFVEFSYNGIDSLSDQTNDSIREVTDRFYLVQLKSVCKYS